MCDELLALAFLWPLLEGDLSVAPLAAASGRPLVFATDAEGTGGIGACEAEVAPELWGRLYMLTEEKGEYVRLDWADSGSEAPPPRI
eukprot:1753164-Lingulodinium_polyedra.AAC.1